MKKICIIGGGQLGSRHMQALVQLNIPYQLFMVDPSGESLQTCRSRWQEVNGAEENITFVTAINEIPKQLDLVIVATGAAIRRKVVEQLLQHASVTYLVLEKFLFQGEEDYSAMQDLLQNKQVKTWVNTPRRMFRSYAEVKKDIRQPLVMTVAGSNWGLGCNSIHWLDLFCWLTGEKAADLTVLLNEGSVPAKREGYVEFNGSVLAEGSGGSRLLIHCFDSGDHPVLVNIHAPSFRAFINEGGGFMERFSSANGWQQERSGFVVPRQSELTHVLASDLFEKGNCDLPTYEESMQMHLLLLDRFLQHYNQHTKTPGNKLCPIT